MVKKRTINTKKITWILLLFALNLFLFALFVAITPSQNIAQAAVSLGVCSDTDGIVKNGNGANQPNRAGTSEIRYLDGVYRRIVDKCWAAKQNILREAQCINGYPEYRSVDCDVGDGGICTTISIPDRAIEGAYVLAGQCTTTAAE